MIGNIYKLNVAAGPSDIFIDETYDDYETARHEYESWKYDPRVKDARGWVRLVELGADEETHKFAVTRDLGEHQW